MRLTLVLLVLALTVAPVHAQAPDLELPTWLFVTATAADLTLTSVCAQGVCEGASRRAHPLLAGVDDFRVSVPVGLAIDGAIVGGTHLWLKPRHPKVAAGLLYGLTMLRVVLLTHRIDELRRNTVRRR